MKKMYENIRTGVIGVGSMGQNHARVYSEISNLVGVCDSNKFQGEEIAAKYNVPFYSDIDELLKKVDAVTIAVPTTLHLPIARRASSHGVNMLIEKPLSISPKDSEEIIKLAYVNKVKLAVGHIERHNSVIGYAKRKILSGKWGEVISLSSKRVSNYPERITDVGVVFDLGIHDLDILSYLTGEKVSSVYAVGGNKKLEEKEDFVSIVLTFESGKVGYCEINWLTPMKIRSLNINCTSRYIELDYISQSAKQYSSKFLNLDKSNLYSTELDIKLEESQIEKVEPLRLELLDFLNSIETDSDPLVTGEDGLNAVIIATAVLNSLKSKKKVDLI